MYEPPHFEAHFIELAAGQIHYLDAGSGPTLILIHGAPMTSFGYRRLIACLQKRFRVLAPDLPGFGASQAAASFRHRLEDYSECMRAFCQAVAPASFSLLANDAGGWIGLRLAADLADRIDGLIVVSAAPFPLTGSFRPVKWFLSHVVASGPVRWLNQRLNLFPWLVSTLAPYLSPWPRAERKAYQRQFATHAQRERIIALFEQMGTDTDFALALEAEMPKLAQIPTLLIFGQFDPVRLLGAGRRYHRMFSQSREVVLPWEEHFPMLASADKMAAAIEDWMQEELWRDRPLRPTPTLSSP